MSQGDYDAADLNHNEDHSTNTDTAPPTNSDENNAENINNAQLNGQVDVSGSSVDEATTTSSDDTLSIQQTNMTNGHARGEGSSSPNGVESDGGGGEGEGGAMAMGDSQGSSEGDAEYNSEGFDADLRRVKLYELIGSRWVDRGTAFCQGDFDDNSQEAKLVARSEINPNVVLLNSAIRLEDVYHRQQDTLIVWTEVDGTDFALSFQDAEGCAEVWEFIIEVQKHLSTRMPPSSTPTTAQVIQSGRLPWPEPSILGEIEKAVKQYSRNPKIREAICENIQHEKYIQSMIEIFNTAEEQEDLDTLHALFTCLQAIILINEHTMYEHILHDDLWLGVIGILEYDPDFPKYKANYREFFSQRSKFLQPIKINDELVQTKIHHAYRLQYLKDVILSRVLDDATFNVLSSCIHFNQIDIITHIQSDERFLSDLVGVFMVVGKDKNGKGKEKANTMGMDVDTPVINGNGVHASSSNGGLSIASTSQQESGSASSEDTSDARKRDIILLLQQLCVMGKNVQLPARIALFKALVERGILYAVQWALCQHDRPLVSIAGEILAVLLDHHTAGVRVHIGQQAHLLQQHPYNTSKDATARVEAHPSQQQLQAQENADKRKVLLSPSLLPFKESIMQVLCRMLADSQELALQNQLADALRMVLEIPPQQLEMVEMVLNAAKGGLNRQQKEEVENFLENFYSVSVDTLFRPILKDVPEYETLQGPSPIYHVSRERANLYLYLCDLLCSFVHQHMFQGFYFILRTKIAVRVATLLFARDKHLSLAALRFFRVCLRATNKNLLNHLISLDVFTPIAKLTVREARRDNILSCTCQEFFEHIRMENNRSLIASLMSKHMGTFRELSKDALGALTFRGLITRHEMNIEPPPKEDEKRMARPQNSRTWGQGHLPEVEEENYFNDDDDEEIPTPPIARTEPLANMPRRRRQRISMPDGVGAVPLRTPTKQQAIVPSQQRPQTPTPLGALVDYDDDDDVIGPQPASAASSSRVEAEPRSVSVASVTPRQIQIPAYDPDEPSSDPEDDMLEALVTHNEAAKRSPSPKFGASDTTKDAATSATDIGKLSGVPPIQRDKRRREEDDDDELLVRIAAKSKRANSVEVEGEGRPSASKSTNVTITAANKSNEEGPKKLKLKIGLSKGKFDGASQASSTGTKDGDRG